MANPIEIRSSDALLQQLAFKKYRYTTKRRAEQFLPDTEQPQTMDVETRWGGILTGKYGDFLVSELDDQDEQWVVEKEIFEISYQEVEVGIYTKKATVDLVPLTDVTRDPDQLVTVYSLEGPLTVRAGGFYLARGVKGEIWLVSQEHNKNSMELAE